MFLSGNLYKIVKVLYKLSLSPGKFLSKRSPVLLEIPLVIQCLPMQNGTYYNFVTVLLSLNVSEKISGEINLYIGLE